MSNILEITVTKENTVHMTSRDNQKCDTCVLSLVCDEEGGTE